MTEFKIIGYNNDHPSVIDDITCSVTGAMLMPRGISDERPPSAVQGMLRYNTEEHYFEYFSGETNSWSPISDLPSGTNGDVIISDGTGGINSTHKLNVNPFNGTITATGALTVVGGVGIGENLNVANTTTTTNLTVYNQLDASGVDISNNLTVYNQLDASGVDISNNLNVSNTTTTTNLTVYNQLDASGVDISNNLNVANTTTTTNLTVYNQLDASGVAISNNLNVGTTLYVDDTNKRVGIGTASPTARLHVGGKFSCHNDHIRLGNRDFRNLNNVAVSVDAVDIGATDAAAFCTQQDSNWVLVFYNSARTQDKGKIRGVNSTEVAYDTTSDRRLKENITPMPSMLEKIKQLKPVYYTWKEDGKKGDGFIAQEVHKVLPQLRDYNCWDKCKCGMTFNDAWEGKTCMCCDVENPKNTVGNDYTFGLDYGKFTPYIIKAMQEQQEIIERQEKLIQSLEARILALESK